jgi:hypothetical protein
MQRALIAQGATVLGFTLPDLSKLLPLARPLSPRVHALNEALRRAAENTGAVLIDFARYPVGVDRRIWSPDRLHANSAGHQLIAAALAWALGLAGTDESWSRSLPSVPAQSRRARIRADLQWGREYFLPWVLRVLRGQSSGEGRSAKRPVLGPVESPG